VNEQNEEIRLTWHARPEHRGVGNAACAASRDEDFCFEVPAARHLPPVAHRLALFHYVTKSLEDYEIKLARGTGVPMFSRNMGWFDKIKRCGRDACN
jgi:hypothetical protein